MKLLRVILQWCLHDTDAYLDPQQVQPTPALAPDGVSALAHRW